MKKILFTGGGSAGHVIPNLALIEEILSTGEADVAYMGTNGIEKTLISEWKLPFYEIECPKLIRGGGFSGFKRNLKIPAALARAQKQATEGLLTIRPDLVFSKGGYVSLPVVFAARKLHIPCFAHESDFSPGLSNKLCASKCERVFTSFPETAEKFRHGEYSGAPIRRSILSATRADARKKLDIPFKAKVLLIFGGGSGSAAINEAVFKCLKNLTKSFFVLHVCGKGNTVNHTMQNYRQFDFIADMGTAYAAADVIISRAGAGAIFEILALKKPALFIPLEGQTRGDQIENAAYFANKKLCRVLAQSDLEKLPIAINETFLDTELKQRLGDTDFARGNENILRSLRKALQ